MDRLLFGDNQFFGVNHMSEERARAQMMRFQSLSAVIDVLDSAYEAGVLAITLPKKEVAKPKAIKVQVSNN